MQLAGYGGKGDLSPDLSTENVENYTAQSGGAALHQGGAALPVIHSLPVTVRRRLITRN